MTIPRFLVCPDAADPSEAGVALMLCTDHLGVMMNHVHQAAVALRVERPWDARTICPVCRKPARPALMLFGQNMHHACVLPCAQSRVTVRVG